MGFSAILLFPPGHDTSNSPIYLFLCILRTNSYGNNFIQGVAEDICGMTSYNYVKPEVQVFEDKTDLLLTENYWKHANAFVHHYAKCDYSESCLMEIENDITNIRKVSQNFPPNFRNQSKIYVQIP